MTKTQEKINKLRHEASMINFAEHISTEGYARLNEIESEIKKLESKQHGGWVVAIYPNFNSISNEPNYLTEDANLCMCSDPTYFKTKKEALEHLKAADLNPKNWRTEIRKEVK